MYCLHCGTNIDGLEEQCRSEFNRKHAQHFYNMRMVYSHQWYWRGVWIGIAVDFLVVCFLMMWMDSWSWNGFLEVIHRISKKGYILFLMPIVFPFVTAMARDMFAIASVDAKEERLYQKFKETWGLPKHVEVTKEIL